MQSNHQCKELNAPKYGTSSFPPYLFLRNCVHIIVRATGVVVNACLYSSNELLSETLPWRVDISEQWHGLCFCLSTLFFSSLLEQRIEFCLTLKVHAHLCWLFNCVWRLAGVKFLITKSFVRNSGHVQLLRRLWNSNVCKVEFTCTASLIWRPCTFPAALFPSQTNFL
jgi:hypothetical protein